jgi:6-phosphogluconolactonase
MHHDLVVVPDSRTMAAEGASRVAAAVRAAAADGRRFDFAVSGGHTPWAMFGELAGRDLPWEAVRIFQVDERVAPDGDPDRNLTNLRSSLGDASPEVLAMPVGERDLDAAASSYARALPEHFDLVHLGLGPDGHTASLVPGDPVLEVESRLVSVTRSYQGRRRMTLTYRGLARAKELIWLVAGADKADALARLLRGDRSIPAGRLRAERSVILADAAAAARIGSPESALTLPSPPPIAACSSIAT